MGLKIRKIKHRSHKFFGLSNEKWARGGGRWGYGRHYGANKHGNNIDPRTRAERLNRDQRYLDDVLELSAQYEEEKGRG